MDHDDRWTNKHFLLAAAPQCPFPDQSNLEMLDRQVPFDMVFVQFYNNPWCGLNSFEMNADSQSLFNMKQWDNWAENESKNPNVKIFLGIPGAAGASGSGYEEGDKLAAAIKHSKTFKSFGGVMVWDMSQAYKNPGFLNSIIDSLGTLPSRLDTLVQLTDASNPPPLVESAPAELPTTTLASIPTPLIKLATITKPTTIIAATPIAVDPSSQLDDEYPEDLEIKECDDGDCAREWFSDEADKTDEMSPETDMDGQVTQIGGSQSRTTLSARASSTPTGAPRSGSYGKYFFLNSLHASLA